MQTSFKVGEKVRVRGMEPVGTVSKVGEMIVVEYEPRPGTVTLGIYPPGHLELVSREVCEGGEGRSPASAIPSLPSSPSRDTKPRATTKDILS